VEVVSGADRDALREAVREIEGDRGAVVEPEHRPGDHLAAPEAVPVVDEQTTQTDGRETRASSRLRRRAAPR